MRLGSFTNLRLAEIGTGVPHEMKLFWPPSPMAVYISPIASITPQICSEQATRQPTTTTISERPKMRTAQNFLPNQIVQIVLPYGTTRTGRPPQVPVSIRTQTPIIFDLAPGGSSRSPVQSVAALFTHQQSLQ